MTSRDVMLLAPECRTNYLKFSAAMLKAGIDYILVCTYRSPEEQLKLLALGNTRAKPGKSKHNRVDAKGKPASYAFDIVIMIHGKPEWSGTHPLWREVGKIGKACGMVWGGDFRSLKDWGHFEMKE